LGSSNPDIVVYGGSSAAVTAAVAAARAGCSVTLANPGTHVGGMTSGGLGATDVGDPDFIGGLAKEFYRHIGERYGAERQFRFEPHVAEEVLAALLDDAGVSIARGCALREVEKQGRTIRRLGLRGRSVSGRVFIDASYEGDLMSRAGVRYRVGRESNAEHGETLNGCRGEAMKHNFELEVDPYIRRGDPRSGLLPLIQATAPAAIGTADDCVEAYNFRLCLTLEERNRRSLRAPRDYDPFHYELLGRLIDARAAAGIEMRFSDFFLIVALPNGKTDFNSWGPLSTDNVGASWDYPEADEGRRVAIREAHRAYTEGVFHFLATDERVPLDVRLEARIWGLCLDEFRDSEGWPHQLYVREARRMIGETVMTQHHCQGTAAVEHPVAVAAFPIDTHNCQRIVQGGKLMNEGDIEVEDYPHSVGYGALLPRPEDCDNLLVPVCLSATHVAYGSLRTEPVLMQLGEAAGLAAALAVTCGKSVQEIDRAMLERELSGAKAVIRPEHGRRSPPWPHERLR
jgi:FAD dependent oxidoreductase